MTRTIYILTSFILFGCGTNEDLKNQTKIQADSSMKVIEEADNWTFDTVKNRTLLFKNGLSFETGLYEIEYIGQISCDKKAPFLIYSGRDCDKCDANIAIYIHSPSDGTLAIQNGQNRYEYPGALKFYEDNRLLQTSRAFFGQVLDNVTGVIWFTKDNSNKKPDSIYLIRLDNGLLKDTSFVSQGTIEKTLMFAGQGLCKEIPGRELTSEP